MSADIRTTDPDVRPAAAIPTAPARVMIASYRSYAEAQRAVDYLSDHDFPVERTAIVAEGLRFVEQVTGRMSWGRAALNGVMSGLWVGLFVSLLFWAFSLFDPAMAFWEPLLWGLGVGAVFGLIAGLLGYAMTSGRRDFTSIGGMQADRYEVIVDAEVADKAREMLMDLNVR